MFFLKKALMARLELKSKIIEAEAAKFETKKTLPFYENFAIREFNSPI